MNVYYKTYRIESVSSLDGVKQYDERMFLVEMSYKEYLDAARLINQFQMHSREYFDSIWWIDPVQRRLFMEIGERIKEDDFPEWYLKACAVDDKIAKWNLMNIDDTADIVRVDTFKQLSVEFTMNGAESWYNRMV